MAILTSSISQELLLLKHLSIQLHETLAALRKLLRQRGQLLSQRLQFLFALKLRVVKNFHLLNVIALGCKHCGCTRGNFT